MKKFFAFIMAVVIVFSLTSCMTRKTETIVESPIPEENISEIIEEEISEEIEIYAGVFWYDFSDAFLSTVREAMNHELDTLGIKYTNHDAAGTQATQNDQIDSAIASGANLLIVNIVDTAAIDAAQAIADKAKAADIPIIFFNREVDDSVINSYENACFVGTRAAEAGEKQGTMIGKYIIENYDAIDLNKDGLISYIMMKGELGCSEESPRTQFAVEFCNAELISAEKPELTYYDPNNTDKFQPSNWSKTTAFELMETALSTNPMDGEAPIEIVICINDDAALGCVEALNNVGWNTGDGNTIPVFGIDYTADAAAAIEAGKMAGSILQSATGMAETVAALVENVMNSKHVFDSAVDVFNVDKDCAKIRVPYEVKI